METAAEAVRVCRAACTNPALASSHLPARSAARRVESEIAIWKTASASAAASAAGSATVALGDVKSALDSLSEKERELVKGDQSGELAKQLDAAHTKMSTRV